MEPEGEEKMRRVEEKIVKKRGIKNKEGVGKKWTGRGEDRGNLCPILIIDLGRYRTPCTKLQHENFQITS